MDQFNFSKRYKSNFVLIFISLVFLFSLCFCILLIFKNNMVEQYLEIIIHSENKNITDYIRFFIGMFVLSGFLMFAMFFRTILNLYKAYDETEILNAQDKKRMTAIEASREGISILNDNGNFEYMNRAHSDCYGYESSEYLLGKTWRALYTAKEQIFIDNIFQKDLKETGWWAGHSNGRKKDGSEFPQEISFSSLDDGGIVCVVRDISQYIKKENTMQIIKLAIDAATDGIFITDKENKFVFVNKSFMALHDLKIEDKNKMAGVDWRSIYKKEEQDIINSKILPMTIIKGFWNGSLNFKRSNGHDFSADISLTKLPNDLVLGVFRDATERKALEKEREKLKDQMFHSQKVETVTRLIKGISADFKSSISVIRNNLDLAFANDDVPEERRKYMMHILNATDNANDMIGQLLSLSEGKNANAGVVDVIDSVLQTNNKMVHTFQDNIKFFVNIKIDSAHIWGDETQVQNCILGLCINSVESLPDKSGAITLFLSDTNQDPLEPELLKEFENKNAYYDVPSFVMMGDKLYLCCGQMMTDHKYIRLGITDNGAGIAPDILSNILDPFFSTKAASTSSGLGLSTIKGVILALKGAMMVESVVGKGTSVHLFIPVLEGQNYGMESAANLKNYN